MEHSRRVMTAVLALLFLVPSAALAAGRNGRMAASTTVSEEKVNINTASVKELMTLKGIRHKVAERIVEYRDAHGPFKAPEDLRKVGGIGHGLWEQNRERIVVK